MEDRLWISMNVNPALDQHESDVDPRRSHDGKAELRILFIQIMSQFRSLISK
jgi:hypothetical protein